MITFSDILGSLEIPPVAQNIYSKLLSNKSLSARALAEILSIPRPSVYDHIKILKNKNLILSKKEGGKTLFTVNDPNTIKVLLDKKKDTFTKASNSFDSMLASLRKQTESVEPKISFFSGVEGIKSVQNDILWYRDIETYTMWPTKEVIELLGDDYLAWHNKRRSEQGVSILVIRQGEKLETGKYPYVKEGKEFLRTVKYLPKDYGIHMSYWVYADKVAFFESGNELYGFIVHSKSFAHMMKIHFMFVWDMLKN